MKRRTLLAICWWLICPAILIASKFLPHMEIVCFIYALSTILYCWIRNLNFRKKAFCAEELSFAIGWAFATIPTIGFLNDGNDFVTLVACQLCGAVLYAIPVFIWIALVLVLETVLDYWDEIQQKKNGSTILW